MAEKYTYRGYTIQPSRTGRTWDVMQNMRSASQPVRFQASGFKSAEEAEEKVDALRRASRQLSRLDGRLKEGVW